MTLTPIGNMSVADLTPIDAPALPRRAQMLSRRVNNVASTVITEESHVDDATGQMKARRNHGSQTDVVPVDGIKDGGLRTQEQD